MLNTYRTEVGNNSWTKIPHIEQLQIRKKRAPTARAVRAMGYPKNKTEQLNLADRRKNMNLNVPNPTQRLTLGNS